MVERFFKYPRVRDVVFVLGAGASAPDGVPLQRDLIRLICRHKDLGISRTAVGRMIDDFFTAFFDADIGEKHVAGLEEVFGLIDYHVEHREHLSELWTDWALLQVRDALVKAIHYAVHAKRAEEPANYRSFWDIVAATNRNISVVTMNYDSVLEEAFDHLYPEISSIDYCLPLINYDWEEAGFNWWVNPREPFRDAAKRCVPIKILKLHGSLNWKYCACCRGVLLTPWDTAIDLDRGGFTYPEWQSDGSGPQADYVCPHDGVPFETCIVPPSHVKRLTHPALSPVISETVQELRAARRIVFVGCSFPEADVHVRGLLSRAVRTRDVFVVDPGLTPQAQARFRSVSPDVRFIEKGFEAVLANGTLAHLLDIERN